MGVLRFPGVFCLDLPTIAGLYGPAGSGLEGAGKGLA
jgi:hypothetical protein